MKQWTSNVLYCFFSRVKSGHFNLKRSKKKYCFAFSVNRQSEPSLELFTGVSLKQQQRRGCAYWTCDMYHQTSSADPWKCEGGEQGPWPELCLSLNPTCAGSPRDIKKKSLACIGGERSKWNICNQREIERERKKKVVEMHEWREGLIIHLPGELLKDVAAVSVQNSDGLGKVMSLAWRIKHNDKTC